MMREKDPITMLWNILNESDGEIPIEKVFSLFKEHGFDKKTAEKAISFLHSLYFIEYKSDGNGVLIKKKEILGLPFEELPCLGCEHLYECRVGGDSRRPESCLKFEAWLQKLIQNLKRK